VFSYIDSDPIIAPSTTFCQYRFPIRSKSLIPSQAQASVIHNYARLICYIAKPKKKESDMGSAYKYICQLVHSQAAAASALPQPCVTGLPLASAKPASLQPVTTTSKVVISSKR